MLTSLALWDLSYYWLTKWHLIWNAVKFNIIIFNTRNGFKGTKIMNSNSININTCILLNVFDAHRFKTSNLGIFLEKFSKYANQFQPQKMCQLTSVTLNSCTESLLQNIFNAGELFNPLSHRLNKASDVVTLFQQGKSYFRYRTYDCQKGRKVRIRAEEFVWGGSTII